MRKLALLLPIVWAAIAVHTTWAFLLMLPNGHPSAHDATPVHAVVEATAGSTQVAIAVLLGVSLIAGFSHAVRSHYKWMCIVPQQLVLGISAAAGVRAVFEGHYADGVARPAAFIFADQLPSMGLFVAHTAVVIVLFALAHRYGEDLHG